MKKYTRYSLEERINIEKYLDHGYSLSIIAKRCNRDLSGLRKEIKTHLVKIEIGRRGQSVNNCALRESCRKRDICHYCTFNHKLCRGCIECNSTCTDFVYEPCPLLAKSPYCCNRCSLKNQCFKTKYYYSASKANNEAKSIRSTSRQGLSYSPEEIDVMNQTLQTLIKDQSQSVHAAVSSNQDIFPISERHIYNLIDQNIFTTRNIDLPRKVRYKGRKKKKTVLFDRTCRENRTYMDYLAFIFQEGESNVVEMDTVIGNHQSLDCLLTIYFRNCGLQLSFIRSLNNARSVSLIFDQLYELLGRHDFQTLFPCILTDNGFEFSNPKAIEFVTHQNPGEALIYGQRRTRLFYCDPAAPHQKGACERNHEFIRLFFPKGSSFKGYSQDQINLMMNHINNYHRKKMNDRSPYQLFIYLYGQDIAAKLGLVELPHNEVCLNPSIFK